MSAEARKFTKDDVLKHINPNCLWVRLVAYDEQQSQNSELAANIGIKADWIEAKMNEAGADAKRIVELEAVVAWYGDQVYLYANDTTERAADADVALDQDGGKKARAALKETGVAS